MNLGTKDKPIALASADDVAAELRAILDWDLSAAPERVPVSTKELRQLFAACKPAPRTVRPPKKSEPSVLGLWR